MKTRLVMYTPRAAFTLIELLTVIAIIGILAAIIIPTVGKVRLTAQSATTLSNLRQLQLGNIAYANDNKGRFLDATPGKATDYGRPWFVWSGFLSYIGIAMPASGANIETVTGIPGSFYKDWDQGYPAIAMTGKPVTLEGKLPGCYTLSMNSNFSDAYQGRLTNPTRLIAFGDCTHWMLRPEHWDKWVSDELAKPNDDAAGALAFRYSGKANVAFADGHAGKVTKVELQGMSTAERDRYFKPYAP